MARNTVITVLFILGIGMLILGIMGFIFEMISSSFAFIAGSILLNSAAVCCLMFWKKK